MHRIENVEQSIRDLSRGLKEIERDYTTREEWLRESMHARQQLERLTEMTAKVQTQIEDNGAMAAELARACRAIADAAGALMGQGPEDARRTAAG
jgi:DNA repair exonuclease SbcCD ATPase subunit